METTHQLLDLICFYGDRDPVPEGAAQTEDIVSKAVREGGGDKHETHRGMLSCTCVFHWFTSCRSTFSPLALIYGCLYCCQESSAEGPEMKKAGLGQVSGFKSSWKENNNAERIFKLLPERDSHSYSTLIRGMVKVGPYSLAGPCSCCCNATRIMSGFL